MDFTEQIALPELVSMATPAERFADLVGRQSRFVYRVAYVVVRNVQDAEDVVQDLFLKLHRSGAWDQMEDEQ
jgi:RNA polymerase sigma-70 factor, ECF subfamily